MPVCVAEAEAPDWLGFTDELGDAELAEELGPVAGLEALSTSAGASDAETGVAPVPPDVEVEMVATLPTGAPLPPPALARLPKTRKPTIAMPAQPPVILSPKPRRLRERRPR